MQIPRWKNLLILRNSFSPPSHFSHFHSTPISLAKWKNKWNPDTEKGQQPAKNYIRYATRQKRADARTNLKDLLSKTTSHKVSFQDDDIAWRADRTSNRDVEEDTQPRSKKSSGKAKPHRSSHFGKRQHTGSKRKQRKENFYDYYGNPETIFHATFGNRCFTWSFRSWEDSQSQNSPFGFEWRDGSDWKHNTRRLWETCESDDDEPSVIGSFSDRTTLGLPSTGPLKMEDVKSAFRASALKWHPDKHQGPSQAMAEEKFKLCAEAYKSLCTALSSV
ncbi:chaperone DnaJ-domain superfamily protein [Tasmannia lanceolata]|uniref:chaperone DnaJ-domain superfamily protein n=1 Tax=Tasmannia lanceolata TaxID=3420 RepID=UPI004064A37D